jgi:nitrite reductase/ring-hydroxylating ferredoxin subunit
VGRYVVGRAADLPPGSHRVVRAGRAGVGVFNVHGTYYALNNYCPHAGGPLCLGDVTGTTEDAGAYTVLWVRQGEIVSCPWHAWEFDIATGRTITEPTKSVRTYPVWVEDGQVILETDGDPGSAARRQQPEGG